MSDITTPVGETGGDTPVSAGSRAAHPKLAALSGKLPGKVRVHALAKLLNRSSREVLDTLKALGEPGRSAQSSLARELALKVADRLAGTEPANGDEPGPAGSEPAQTSVQPEVRRVQRPLFAAPSAVFLQPDLAAAEPAGRRSRPDRSDEPDEQPVPGADADFREEGESAGRRRRRRGRRGRGRGKGGQIEGENGTDDSAESDESSAGSVPVESDRAIEASEPDTDDNSEAGEAEGDGSRRRRRRRRRRKDGDGEAGGMPAEVDPPNTVVHVREGRPDKNLDRSGGSDEVRSVRGSTRLEAKRQRRRDGREAGRRKLPILSEAEFLARRESVQRKMVVRERGQHVQIGVLEDGVLVEHFVTSHGSGSLVGNVYLGRVQNVLPSMEAAFVDIGRGRNAVLYAGEVDWDAAGLEGKARKIEQALSTGDSVLVQVTKDPVGHKGARLTTQISLPGRFLVYVPGGGATGISRKLPDIERKRLKEILKRVVPQEAGVIVRTASEGIIEEELDRDVKRLQAEWEVISEQAESKSTKAPELLYEEPDLLIKVVRDLFTEDFVELIVQGDQSWDTIDTYVRHVAPDLAERLKRHVGTTDVFTEYRIDEQIIKALDRKVWLPSGGYLVIDRTEAMTVIDVNTGKFTGAGGNLEETVTRNNLESAEEIVRQLRLRDIGGIIVIDFIDMVLESNRDLVLRRLTECLGRDRTRHQVAEVTSLGLVQMTRKRIGTDLLEAFSTPCEHCRGRGVIVSTEPTGSSTNGGNGGAGSGATNGSRKGRNRGRNGEAGDQGKTEDRNDQEKAAKRIAAFSLIHQKAGQIDQLPDDQQEEQPAEPEVEPQQPEPGTVQVEQPPTELEDGRRNGQVEQADLTEPARSPARQRRRASRPGRRAASRPAGPPESAGHG